MHSRPRADYSALVIIQSIWSVLNVSRSSGTLFGQPSSQQFDIPLLNLQRPLPRTQTDDEGKRDRAATSYRAGSNGSGGGGHIPRRPEKISKRK